MELKNVLVGVDIGGTSIKIGFFDLEGELIDKWEVDTRKELGINTVIKDIADSIIEKLSNLNLSIKNIVGVGMGIPGPVLPDGEVEICINLGWENINPAALLSKELGGITVKSNNDANVAALGEMWKGGGKGYSDIVMVTLGTGVGGGIIINEHILSGVQGLAGEIGHIHVKDEAEELSNGGNNCYLEQIASATGIVRVAKRKLSESDKPSALRNSPNISAKDVLDAAKAGDELAEEVVEFVASYIGTVFSNITLTINPEAFVIGGGVSKAGEYLINIIDKHYKQQSVFSKYYAKIKIATLGNDAGIYGAAKLVM